MNELAKSIVDQDRLSLAKAITLVESENLQDQKKTDELFKCLSLLNPEPKSLRVGISGVPGVGKSTAIESVGLSLLKRGYSVAVLAIDPSSDISKGSILGDKTRMEELAKNDKSFIRPSASRGQLGGVAAATKDALKLCEYAGYNFILIETVGVGQSEVLTTHLVDVFTYLALPGAGDELQGIKKGILEHVDLVAVNKSEGPNKVKAELTKTQLLTSLKILRNKSIPVVLISALTGDGILTLCDKFEERYKEDLTLLIPKRVEQEQQLLSFYLEHFLKLWMESEIDANKYKNIIDQISLNQSDARSGAREIFKSIF